MKGESYIEDIRNAARDEGLPWDDLKGRNVLVTGASGLIGGCVAEFLAESGAGCHVWACGRNRERLEKRFAGYVGTPGFDILCADITKPLPCSVDFDFIIHAAGFSNPALYSSRPVEVIRTNTEGTTALLEYGIRHNLKRFIYVSSGEVYGQLDKDLIAESDSGYVDCTAVRSCYPSSKRACESLCVAYWDEYGVDCRIARPAHIFGPKFTESDNRVYAQFIRNVLAGEDIVMKSDGSQMRSWCYVVDCASAILYIMLKGSPAQAYNICDGRYPTSIRELAMMTAEIAGRKVRMEIPEENEKKGYNPVTKSVFVASKLGGLGWRPQGTMYDNLWKTIKQQQDDERTELG
ncbi:MAG: NAD-dependent epimerase/dehydratase family protein [Candidatus Cryptobacteroides sp.]